MSDILNGCTAIVTGCNRGIGRAILTRFSENGCDTIFAITRNNSDDFLSYVSRLSTETRTVIRVINCDFSSESDVKSAVKEILSFKIPIDILVNNIGTNYTQKPFSMMKIEELKDTFQVNFFSHLILTQGVMRHMTKSRTGSIVFISSIAAFDGGANVAYVSTKAAICGTVKRLAIECAPIGIRVNAIAPGFTDTDMISSLSSSDEEMAIKMQIMQRKGRPEEIADAVMFLSSSMSSFITGQTIRVDGGVR